MDHQDIDFFSWGERCARSQVASLQLLADEIEKDYGADARMEFEVGVSNCVARYSYFNYIRNIEQINELTKAIKEEKNAYIEQQYPKQYTEEETRQR